MFKGAPLALWLARDANLSAVMDELMAELNPAVFGDDFFEVMLDLDGLGVGREFKTA